MRFPTLVLAVTGVLALSASDASAQLAMTWDAPAGCPDRTALLHEIEDLAPDSVARGPIDARAFEEADRWRATVTSTDGARELEGRSCATVTSAVALVIATAMVVPRAVAETADIPARTGATNFIASSEERTSPVSVTRTIDSPPEPEADRSDDGLRLVVGGQTGVALGAAVDAAVSVNLGIRAEGFEAGLVWTRILRVDEPSRDTDRTTFRLAWVLSLAPFEVAFRVLGEVYSSFSGPGNERRGVLWGALGIGLELRFWMEEAAALVLSWDSTVPVSNSPVHLMGPERAEDVPSFVGTLAGGVLFQIP